MKKSKLFLTLAAGLLAATFASRSLAADTANHEVTLTGKMVCGRCVLHESKRCQNVLEVKKDGKTVNYWLTQNKVSKDFHHNICQNDGEKATVTGKVVEKNGKEILMATTIKGIK